MKLAILIEVNATIAVYVEVNDSMTIEQIKKKALDQAKHYMGDLSGEVSVKKVEVYHLEEQPK